jgi:peptide/nickel transport system substrate-binding protein
MGRDGAFGAVGLLLAVILFAGPVAAATPFYREAPMLAALVTTGELPPVEQRLPGNPMLVEPLNAVGTYGGTWHMAMRASFDHASFIRTIGYENLVRWAPDWSELVPNIAQSVEASADAKAFKFTLRRGLKWSDGAPFTADDILFWFEDILLNKELTPSIPSWLLAGDTPVDVEKIDDVTVIFRFETPNSLFLQLLAAPEAAEPTSYPKHYLSAFLPKYNPDLANSNWADRFRAAFGTPGNIDDSTRWMHPEVPTLNAWKLEAPYGSANPLIAVRNPYYWKIDPAGQQLPYIDRVSFAIVKDRREAADLALQGVIDMQARHIRCCGEEILAARPEYMRLKVIPTQTNELIISFNFSHRNPALRTVFQQRDFRIALSIGLDRARMTKADPKFIPWQVAPLPQSRHYNERLATQYLEHDPVRANAMLDALGYGRPDRDGWRLGPDGAPISFAVNSFSEERHAWLLMAAEDWRALGIRVTPQLLPREDYVRRLESNQFDAAGYTGDGGVDAIVFAEDFVPLGLQTAWGLRWARWYKNKNDPLAELPPSAILRQYQLYDGIKSTTDPKMQQDLMRQILDIAADEFLSIGCLRINFDSGIVRQGFRNVPDIMINSWSYPEPAPTNPAQYFFEHPN